MSSLQSHSNYSVAGGMTSKESSAEMHSTFKCVYFEKHDIHIHLKSFFTVTPAIPCKKYVFGLRYLLILSSYLAWARTLSISREHRFPRHNVGCKA